MYKAQLYTSFNTLLLQQTGAVYSGITSVNAGGTTSFPAGVDGGNTVVMGKDVLARGPPLGPIGPL